MNNVMSNTDATQNTKRKMNTAMEIANRHGLGNTRRTEVNHLLLQERGRRNEIMIMKAKGEEDIADTMTKYVESDKLKWHIKET